MSGTGGMQMNAAQMQHQQLIRSQSGGIAGSGMGNTTQMQQLLSQQHQQQTLAMQQSNNQMSLQMQMTQSSSVNSVSSTGTGESWLTAARLAPRASTSGRAAANRAQRDSALHEALVCRSG